MAVVACRLQQHPRAASGARRRPDAHRVTDERRRPPRHPRPARRTSRALRRPDEPPAAAQADGCKKRRLLLVVDPARHARRRLDGLRDDDGGRLRPAELESAQRVPDGDATRCSYDRPAEPLGDPDQQPQPRPRSRRRHLAVDEATRSSRSRTSASTRTPASTSAASRARSSQDVIQAARVQGGSTIAQQFVKNALAGPGQPHGLPEAARGGARLPPDAQVVQGEDPHRVPELDLLRQRRLRHRVGRAHVLRPATPTTSAAARRSTAVRRRS